jgi:transcriptional regulator of aromatic amino acid metabolism
MTENFHLPPYYQWLEETVVKYKLAKVPLLFLGSRGARKERFLNQTVQAMGLSFVEIDCSLYMKKDFFLEILRANVDKQVYLLYNILQLSKENQMYLNKEILNFKEDGVFTWFMSTALPEIRESVRKNFFSEDLYFRLGVSTIDIPPLSSRKKEILPLIQHYIDFYTKKYKKRIKYIDPKLADFLLKFDYPGDWDQLENLVENMVVLGKGRTLFLSDIPKSLFQDSKLYADRKIRIVPGVSLPEYEKEILVENLKVQNGNREKTARVLNVSVRTLYRMLERYGINSEADQEV